MYIVFTRTWWRRNPSKPGGLEHYHGNRRKIGTAETIEEARAMCDEWNRTHEPGKMSRKAEFTHINNY